MTARSKPAPTAEDWRAAIGEAASEAVATQLSVIDQSEAIEESPADRVARMLNDSREDAKAVVKLYQTLPGNKRAWCNDYPINDFEIGGLDLIRREWGPGDYTITIYGTIPGSVPPKTALRARETVTIRAVRGEASEPAPLRRDSEMAEVLKSIADSQAKMLDAIVNRPQGDPMQDMQRMLAMMATMREAFGMGGGREKSSIGEIVAAMKELRAVSEEFSPQRDEPTSLLGMLPQVLETIKTGLQHQAARPADIPVFSPVQIPASISAAPVTQTQPQTNPAELPQPQPQPQPQQTDEEAMIAELKSIFESVIAAQHMPDTADASNLDYAADIIYNKIPDDLIEVLRGEHYLKALAMFIPDAVKHEEWLTKVRNRTLEIFAEEQAASEQTLPMARA